MEWQGVSIGFILSAILFSVILILDAFYSGHLLALIITKIVGIFLPKNVYLHIGISAIQLVI
jgi:hypothetical protein